jgi:DNA replication protein DnaC
MIEGMIDIPQASSRPVHKVSELSIEADVLAENRRLGHENHHRLREHGIRSLDVMGSIGSGKTLLIEKMALRMKDRGLRVACLTVMSGARRLRPVPESGGDRGDR